MIRAAAGHLAPLVFTLSLLTLAPSVNVVDGADRVVYSNDFETGVGAEWTPRAKIRTDTTPIGGRKFLGQFGNDAVTLVVRNLKGNGGDEDQVVDVTVSFDLFVIRSWDGNGDFCCGPDIFEFRAASGPELKTTFSNTGASGNRQACPGPIGSDNEARTGAAESNTLGYIRPDLGRVEDTVYHLSFTFPHAGNAVVLRFSGSGLQPIPDESWGLDNVRVIVSDSSP